MLDMIMAGTVPLAVTTTDIASGFSGDVWDLILHSGPVVKVVIGVLVLLSVCCWGIAFFKFLVMRSAIKESEMFLNIFWERSRLSQTYQDAQQLQQSPLAEIFRSGYMELQKLKKVKKVSAAERAAGDIDEAGSQVFGMGSVKRALDQASISEQARLEKNLSFLATTGNTAPFIGLFGTVWGIMDSFRQIGLRGSANLATVAPGISEALVATAFGLIAAIPAVIAYNYFVSKTRMIASEMDNFSSEFLNIIERHIEALKSNDRSNQ